MVNIPNIFLVKESHYNLWYFRVKIFACCIVLNEISELLWNTSLLISSIFSFNQLLSEKRGSQAFKISDKKEDFPRDFVGL